MEFSKVKLYPITELGISQIYLNEAKIDLIRKWLPKQDIDKMEPLPVRNFGNQKYTLTDGHSRAFAAYTMGYKNVPIIYDEDDIVSNELGEKLYNIDICWCERFGLSNISDLSSRIISDEKYQYFWIERCSRSYNLVTLLSIKEAERIQSLFPNLFLYGVSENLTSYYYENLSGNLFIYTNESLNNDDSISAPS